MERMQVFGLEAAETLAARREQLATFGTVVQTYEIDPLREFNPRKVFQLHQPAGIARQVRRDLRGWLGTWVSRLAQKPGKKDSYITYYEATDPWSVYPFLNVIVPPLSRKTRIVELAIRTPVLDYAYGRWGGIIDVLGGIEAAKITFAQLEWFMPQYAVPRTRYLSYLDSKTGSEETYGALVQWLTYFGRKFEGWPMSRRGSPYGNPLDDYAWRLLVNGDNPIFTRESERFKILPSPKPSGKQAA